MTEIQAGYITKEEVEEGLELLRGEPAAIIEQPRSRITLRDGLDEEWTTAWVKLSTAFKPHIKEIRGAPLAVWLYISLSINRQGVSFPSINKIADDTGYSRNGVMEAIAILEEKGYLTVRRGERKFNLYEPKFASNGRGNDPHNESTQLTSPLLSPDESTFSPDESSGVDLNKRNKRKQELSPEELAKANKLVDAIIANSSGSHFEGREIFLPDHLPLVDWYHKRTGQVCRKKDRNSWMKAVREWVDAGLTPDDLQAAYEVDIVWRKVIANPNELTSKAIALKAQKKAQPKEQEFYRTL